MTEPAEYLTLPEVAAHYRKAVGTIYYWRKTGYGPRGVQVGTSILFARAEIERFDRQLAQEARGGDRAKAG
jgi:predicted DNA-binding transcriptional regulator AlpA